ncbi:GH18021 [Drosophila grimshawi]|uniref:GH18021 n=1 Tax=Drosophila grimshawi TaxID=7222 RepID=B4JHT4_DROGR|nr:GH18021 [Drosophila grimshawi]
MERIRIANRNNYKNRKAHNKDRPSEIVRRLSYSGIHQFSEDEYKHLVKSFSYDTIASDHITIYDPEDVTAVKFDSNSVTLWNMSPPNLMSLLNDLKTDHRKRSLNGRDTKKNL